MPEEVRSYLDYLSKSRTDAQQQHGDSARGRIKAWENQNTASQSFTYEETDSYAKLASLSVVRDVAQELGAVGTQVSNTYYGLIPDQSPSSYHHYPEQVLEELAYCYAVLRGHEFYNGSALEKILAEDNFGNSAITSAMFTGAAKRNFSSAITKYLEANGKQLSKRLVEISKLPSMDAVLPLAEEAIKILEYLKQPPEDQEQEQEDQDHENDEQDPTSSDAPDEAEDSSEEAEGEGEPSRSDDKNSDIGSDEERRPRDIENTNSEQEEVAAPEQSERVKELLNNIKQKQQETRKVQQEEDKKQDERDRVNLQQNNAKFTHPRISSGYKTKPVVSSLQARLLLNDFADYKLIKQGNTGKPNKKIARLPFGELDVFKKDDISSSKLIIMVDASESTRCRCNNYNAPASSMHFVGAAIWDIAAMLGRSFPESRVFAYSDGWHDGSRNPIIVEVPRGERLLCPRCERGSTLNGNTPEEAALEVMEDLLGDQSQGATGVVITDGIPQNPDKCTVIAKRMINKGVKFCSITVSLGSIGSTVERDYYPQEVIARITDKEDLTPVVDTFNFLSSRH